MDKIEECFRVVGDDKLNRYGLRADPESLLILPELMCGGWVDPQFDQ